MLVSLWKVSSASVHFYLIVVLLYITNCKNYTELIQPEKLLAAFRLGRIS